MCIVVTFFSVAKVMSEVEGKTSKWVLDSIVTR
jgi:hypothetical protein